MTKFCELKSYNSSNKTINFMVLSALKNKTIPCKSGKK